MSKYNSLPALLLSLLLTACGSSPNPGLEPGTDTPTENVGESAAATDADIAAGSAEDGSDIAPQPEPVDVDQLAYEAAIETLKNGSTEAALDELQRLSGIVPDKPRIFTNLGLAQFRLEQFEAAEQTFREAVLRDADDAVAHNHLGILQRRKGQFQEALQAYQRAINIDVKYAHAHLNLGILFDLYLQDLEKALTQYRMYQSLTNDENKTVAGWIVDIERRMKTNS